MDADQLTDDEVLALLCLARKLVVADGVVTVAEYAELHALGTALGSQVYARAASRMAEQPTSLGHALGLAGQVTRPEARAFILGTLHDLAGSDGLDNAEQVVLDSVTELWS